MKKALLQVPRSPEHDHSTHKSPVGARLNHRSSQGGLPLIFIEELPAKGGTSAESEKNQCSQ